MLAWYDLIADVRFSARRIAWPVRLLPVLGAVALAALFVAPRFSQKTPSLIDDWFGVRYGDRAFQALIHGNFASSGLEFSGRYRPGYTAVWNYVQWHLLGGPSMAEAASWDVLRIVLFLAATWLLVQWVAGERVGPGGLAYLPPLLLAVTPGVALELVRFGPTEPMMVAGLVFGLALIAQGVVRLIGGAARSHSARALALGMVVSGYLLYLLGVYSKETSVALVVFVPFFLKWMGPRRRIYAGRSRATALSIAALAVALVVPLVHVGVRLATSQNQLHYPLPPFTLRSRVYAAVVSPLIGAPGMMGTWLWFFASAAAIVVAVALARRRERDAWLLGGLLVTAFLMSSLSLARGPTPGRYYIPWLLAVSAVAFRGVARANGGLIVATAAVVVVQGSVATHATLTDWLRLERAGSTAVAVAKGVTTADCPLYLANFDIERRVAIPLLFPYTNSVRIARCSRGTPGAYALNWRDPGHLGAPGQCHPSWRRAATYGSVTLFWCPSFDHGSVPDQYAASGSPNVTFVRLRLTQHNPMPDRLFSR